MAMRTSYHAGGFDPTAPAKNRAEELDGSAGTYTRWDRAGAQLEQRALTADESTALAAIDTATASDANASTLRQQAVQALSGNRTYVGLTSPTAAQTAAQVKALTRQNNGLIRLLLGLLDGTD